MKRLNKRSVIIFIIICMSLGSIIVFVNRGKDKNIMINGGPDKEGGFSYNSDGTVTLGEGMVSNGFWDSETGAIIDQGTLLKPIDRKIKGRISFSQNIPDIRSYLLVIMIDYVQQSFSVDNNEYSTYSFSLKGNESKNINVEVSLSELNSMEFEYMIISEPDMKEFSIDNKNEWKKLLMTKELRTWRLPLSNSMEENLSLKYDNTYEKFDFHGNQLGDGINLTKTHQNIMALPSCKSMEELEIVLGNTSKENSEYVLVAFLNWKQVPFDNENIVKYVDIPSNTNIYYKLTTPKVDSDTPYQIFAFPKPFNNDIRYSAPPTSTLRTIIRASVE